MTATLISQIFQLWIWTICHSKLNGGAGIMLASPANGVQMNIEEAEAAMAWLRIESGMPRDNKVAELSSDESRWAYIVLLCAAKEQEGRFASWQHLEACIPQKHWKYLSEMIEVGLLVRVNDSTDETKARFEIANWDKYQRPYDPNNAVRVARSRAKRKSESNDDVMDGNGALQTITPNGLQYSTVRYDTDNADAQPQEKKLTDRQKILKWLTEANMQKPVGYVMNDLMDMLKAYGYEKTVAALTSARTGGNRTTKAAVSAAEASFRRKPMTQVTTSRAATPTDTSVYDFDDTEQN